MRIPKVTVAIPTRNRPDLLKRAIKCVLGQTFKDFELIVIDNASSWDVKNVVETFKDKRIHYKKNPRNLGIIGNWNKAIEYSKGQYLSIFHDDDIMYPNFLKESVKALNSYPTTGFTFPLLKRVDRDRNFLNIWWEDYDGKRGLIKGFDYIALTIKKERCISLAPSMVFRRSIFTRLGKFKQVYGFNTFDFNMWFKIALNYDVYFIDKVLFEYTIHVNQMSQRHWRTPESPSGPIGMMIEIIDAISKLMRDTYATDPKNRRFLSNKLLRINKKLTQYIQTVIPDI